MILKLKKSRITDWWITSRDDMMNFFNIFSSKNLKGDFVVVGYLDKTKELSSSTNSVIQITSKGVITAQGSFYPFEEAHPLYLKFLLKANKEDTIIASHWKILDQKTNTLIANIITTQQIKNKITFDFIPNNKSKIMFSGYSNQLSKNIVLCPFSKAEGYHPIIGMTESLKSDIYNSSIILENEFIEIVQQVKKLFIEKFHDSYISSDLT